ncbi:MAG: DUF177 domain-containing protein [Bacteroidaceae bacterium]|nr:DUF177 domain-containing protein [Bacteroidaceae bacterium]
MGKISLYKVDLKNLKSDPVKYNWVADNEFFTMLDVQDVQKGKINVELNAVKSGTSYILDFSLKGYVYVTCDRCLDEMTLDVEVADQLKVQLGADFADKGDVIVVPETDGFINVAWYIYEFIALNIPMKHSHAPGKCNKDMESKLAKHSKGDNTEDGDPIFDGGDDTDSQTETDSRWDELKKILDTNND